MEDLKALLRKVSADHGNADIILYQGDVDRVGYLEVTKLCAKANGRSRVVLILATPGGDPNAGYRIARCLGSRYEKVTTMVPFYCKSAGTLICVGADELIIADTGELGPLDMQISKRDELLEHGSGLDLLQTLGHLQSNAFSAFKSFLFDMRTYQISTKIAAQMASELAVGLYGNIFAQVDPVKVGEVNRAMSVAHEYGERLARRSKNVKADALRRLVADYTTHGFVIDRKEAKELFERVRKPTTDEIALCGFVSDDLEPPRLILSLLDNLPAEDQDGVSDDGSAKNKAGVVADGDREGKEGSGNAAAPSPSAVPQPAPPVISQAAG